MVIVNKLIVLLSITILMLIQNAHSADETPIKYFKIRPAICVVEKDKDCHSRFIFSWALNHQTQVCLEDVQSKKQLICDDKLEQELEFVVTVSEANRFDLVPDESPYLVVSQAIDVQQLNKDVRIRHRRIWSVF